MLTHAEIFIPKQREEILPYIKDSLSEIKAKVEYLDENNFEIHGKAVTTFITRGFKFRINLILYKSGTLIESFYYSPTWANHIDKGHFLEPLFKALAKRIPLESQCKYDTMEERDVTNFINDLNESNNDSNDAPLSIIEKKLIKKYEYDLQEIEFFENMELPQKIVIYPIELGNKIEFQSKKSEVIAFLPISWIKNITTVPSGKGVIRNDDLSFKIIFTDQEGKNGSIRMKIKDKYMQELLHAIHSSLEAENEQYWSTLEIPYRNSNGSKSAIIYPKTPFITKDEEVLWINPKIDGTINRYVTSLQAITNFRILEYNYLNHKCNLIILPLLENVIIMNKQITSESVRIGNYVGAGNMMTGIGRSSTTMRTTGDLVFIYQGKPFIRFNQISEPDGLDELVKSAKSQLAASGAYIPTGVSESQNLTDSIICSKCNSSNQYNSKFCNNCGNKLINECSKCNTINPRNSNFCNNCGMSLT